MLRQRPTLPNHRVPMDFTAFNPKVIISLSREASGVCSLYVHNVELAVCILPAGQVLPQDFHAVKHRLNATDRCRSRVSVKQRVRARLFAIQILGAYGIVEHAISALTQIARNYSALLTVCSTCLYLSERRTSCRQSWTTIPSTRLQPAPFLLQTSRRPSTSSLSRTTSPTETTSAPVCQISSGAKTSQATARIGSDPTGRRFWTRLAPVTSS